MDADTSKILITSQHYLNWISVYSRDKYVLTYDNNQFDIDVIEDVWCLKLLKKEVISLKTESSDIKGYLNQLILTDKGFKLFKEIQENDNIKILSYCFSDTQKEVILALRMCLAFKNDFVLDLTSSYYNFKINKDNFFYFNFIKINLIMLFSHYNVAYKIKEQDIKPREKYNCLYLKPYIWEKENLDKITPLFLAIVYMFNSHYDSKKDSLYLIFYCLVQNLNLDLLIEVLQDKFGLQLVKEKEGKINRLKIQNRYRLVELIYPYTPSVFFPFTYLEEVNPNWSLNVGNYIIENEKVKNVLYNDDNNDNDTIDIFSYKLKNKDIIFCNGFLLKTNPYLKNCIEID